MKPTIPKRERTRAQGFSLTASHIDMINVLARYNGVSKSRVVQHLITTAYTKLPAEARQLIGESAHA